MVMDTDEYEQKVTTMLSDNKMYEKLKKDPMQKYKRKLVSILRKFKEDDKITEEQYNYLYPTAENIPRMYCTLKIYTLDNPLRPIVYHSGSIGYNVSRSLASHHLTHLVNEMASIMIEQDDMFLSHNIVSFFTKTMINETLDIIKK